VAYDPGVRHVAFNVAPAIPQTIATINHRATKSFSPEGAAAVLAEVTVLGELALQLLHETAEVPGIVAHPKEVDMVGGDTKIKESDPVFADSIPQAGAVLNLPSLQRERNSRSSRRCVR
jgi:hypothetical protein